MAEKTEVELALNSISWQLKRIADSLESIEDIIHPAPQETKMTNKTFHTRGTN